jgi:transcription termination/antitermination protein NusA
VPDDQLSLAIGREGQNARLAARLTGWRIDIRSETEFAQEEAEHGFEEEEVQGRCAAILSNGRRCPNAALTGSRYCGLDTHQALNDVEGDEVATLDGGDADGAPADEAPQPSADGPEVAVEAPVDGESAPEVPVETEVEVSEVPTADGEVLADASSETEIAVAEPAAASEDAGEDPTS